MSDSRSMNFYTILYKVSIISSTIGALIVFAIWTFTILFTNSRIEMVDLVSNLTGAQMLRSGEGKNLYNLDIQFVYQKEITGSERYNRALPFRTLPFVALLFLPLATLSLRGAYLIFWIVNLFLLLVLIYLLSRTFNNIKSRKISLFLLPLVFYSIISGLVMGQLSIALSIFLLLVYKSFREKKDFWAGFFSSLLIIKMQYITFLPFLFLFSKNKKRFIAGAAVTLSLIFLTSFAVSGPDFIFSYPQFLLATEEGFRGSKPRDMYTLYSAVLVPLGLEKRVAFIINFVLYAAAFFLISRNRKRFGFDLLIILTTFLSILFSVHALNFDLSFLLIPVFILFDKIFSSPKFRLDVRFWLAIAIFLLPWLSIFIPGRFLTFGLIGMVVYLLIKPKRVETS